MPKSGKSVSDYSFKYFGTMGDAMQSLPIGNGDVGANIWVSPDGVIHFLFSKTDAWSELYRLLKVAHVTMETEPRVFADGADFELNIEEGVLSITSAGAAMRIYADALAPCVRISLQTDAPADIRLHFLNYRSEPIDPGYDPSNFFARGGKHGILESADTVAVTYAGGVAQVHRNAESCYEYSLRNQGMETYIGMERDPLLGHTFGAGLYSPDLSVNGDVLSGNGMTELTASVFVDSRYTDSPSELRNALDEMHARYGDGDAESFRKHTQSWKSFWEKAYIYVEGDEDAEQVTRGFLYQRYLTRCADRGKAPMKFNGLLFTADQMKDLPGNYDARNWGAPYWCQNTRIMYWMLLSMGDYESLLPMFDMYLGMVPIAETRCRQYYEHAGILIPETVSFFGLYANSNYGYPDETGIRKEAGWYALRRGEPANHCIRYHYNGMLEVSWMMLEYLKLSGDTSHRTEMLGFIEKTLQFFNQHFERVNGKLVLNPVSALETWQLCVNDTPDIAGLRAVCSALNTMEDIPESLGCLVRDMLPAIPDLPIVEEERQRYLAPCEIKIDRETRNVENPELYAVFPFRIFGLGKEGLETARLTYERRQFRHAGGWSQDPVDAALLGLTDEAAAHLVRQAGMKDGRALFPAFWGPNFDETPDQDHGCMTLLCLINMLLQTDGEEFSAFPAWPEKWDVRFRLPLNHGSFVIGEKIGNQRSVRTEATG